MQPHIKALIQPEPIESMVRVNQAGEYGAKRIYQGQLDFIKDRDAKATIAEMAAQEEVHLAYFSQLLSERGYRPTAMHPLWHVGGYALGAVTAWMSKEAAMACTVAVESVIDEHYAEQETALAESEETELRDHIQRFRAEEREHHDTGLAEGAENATAYPLLSVAIRGITRLAIEVSKRV